MFCSAPSIFKVEIKFLWDKIIMNDIVEIEFKLGTKRIAEFLKF